MRDADVKFHEQWLGLAQPVEGLVFSVPALADAQIAPKVRAGITADLEAHLDDTNHGPALDDVRRFFETFLGYARPGMLVRREDLPDDLAFYAQEGRQQVRPSFAIARGPFESPDDDPFARFETAAVDSTSSTETDKPANEGSPYIALVWDLTTDAAAAALGLDLDKPEAETGPWRYPPTAKLERLLRHTGIPIGFISNRRALRVLYAPTGESSAHLTFRFEDLAMPAGRPLLAALELIFHARRTYGAAEQFTFPGLLRESRSRQVDVTKDLAAQVFEAVEILLEGFEKAAARDCVGDRPDWLRAAIEAPDDHLYQGIVSVVLRLVFTLYAEDQNLVPVQHPMYATHLSVLGLYERLADDSGAHPESMHLRFGAYGRLISLFRAIFLGVQHGELRLPPRRGKLFDPSAYPFVEGGLPDWTAAIALPEERASVQLPSIDDYTIYRVLRRLVVFQGQRLSYRSLDVEQIGAVYESLMGYHVVRVASPAARLGPERVWVETSTLRAMKPFARKKYWKDFCGLTPSGAAKAEVSIGSTQDAASLAGALAELAAGKSGLNRRQVAAGRLVLQPGEERRRTGSHYTPRWLSEKIVERTLEPILDCLGHDRTAEQILNLRICDPAVGSGAFLVAACRILAKQVVDAWEREGARAALTEEYGDALLHARRLVAQRCLYGVDKNAAAVELTKLSLWLVTLSKHLPFTFVDHSIRHGDSLVGLDVGQLASFNWEAGARAEVGHSAIDEALDQALEHREAILALSDREDPASQAEKLRLLEYAGRATEQLRMLADACVGSFFAHDKARAREQERSERLELVRQFFDGDESAQARLDELAVETRGSIAPFHWVMEFPEVFLGHRSRAKQGDSTDLSRAVRVGFDAIGGNMPFLGGRRIATQYGDRYAQWLVTQNHCTGDTDYVGYFFLRAPLLLSERGALGLIATSALAEGQNRRTVLKPLLYQHGFRIQRVDTRLPWPGEANVLVTILHLLRGTAPEPSAWLDGHSVPIVNSRLKPRPERAEPRKLASNHGYALAGCFLRGTGFILDPEEARALLQADPRNADVVRPFVVGDDLNNAAASEIRRWVVDFFDRSLEEAQAYPGPFEVVEQRVRPERERLRMTGADAAHREHWWRFANTRKELRRQTSRLQRYLATARVSKHSAFTFVDAQTVPSEQVVIVPVESWSPFGVLESRVHACWVDLMATRMGAGLRYSASECFDTFPFPAPDPRIEYDSLEAAGSALYQARNAYMHDTGQGLTKTRNALTDPRKDDRRIADLRQSHEALDRAVLDAYGWRDITVPPYCANSDDDRATFAEFVDEVIDRLHVLNGERAREEDVRASRAEKTPKDAEVRLAKAGQRPAGTEHEQSQPDERKDVG